MIWRLNILAHDCLAHPLAGLLWLVNFRILDRIGHWIHDATMYRCECGERFDDSVCPACDLEFGRPKPKKERP